MSTITFNWKPISEEPRLTDPDIVDAYVRYYQQSGYLDDHPGVLNNPWLWLHHPSRGRSIVSRMPASGWSSIANEGFTHWMYEYEYPLWPAPPREVA